MLFVLFKRQIEQTSLNRVGKEKEHKCEEILDLQHFVQVLSLHLK